MAFGQRTIGDTDENDRSHLTDARDASSCSALDHLLALYSCGVTLTLAGGAMFGHMMKLGYDLTMLSFESQQVIALRMARLAMGGPDAARESERMISEKAAAAIETGIHLASGGSPAKVVKSYRRKVRANRDRLVSTMMRGA